MMHRLLLLLIALLTVVPSIHAQEIIVEEATPEPAPLIVWNREIVVFRAPLGNLSPQQRLDAAIHQLQAVEDFDLYHEINAERTNLGGISAISFMVGDKYLFAIVEGDLDPTTGESLSEASKEIVAKLDELRTAKQNQRSMSVILWGIAAIVVSTVIYLALLWVLRFLGKKIRRLFTKRAANLKQLKVKNLDLRPFLLQLFHRMLQLCGWGVALTGAYLWITYILAQFPYTAPWADLLGSKLGGLIMNLLHGILEAIPGLLAVIIIFVITRSVAHLADRLFRQFEFSREEEGLMGRDTARASRRIITVLIWVFAVIIAYPYIPGSESPAFKGVSVFMGLVVSLGSTGLVNQIMSGFVVLYSGAVRTGEYARVGDVEGTITDIGLLSTKVLTPRREYVTVPNAVLISKDSLNYSRQEKTGQRTELSTKVTIGYDTPWRQVHAMLLLATERTPGIRKDSEPVVLQTALSDFYTEYELRFVPSNITKKGAILSELHQRILDTFNEFEVQIMSPNFRAQPEQDIITPKEKWFLPPAKEPEKKGNKDTKPEDKPKGSGSS